MMYSKGDIVIIHFPFSDLIHAKKRPMVVLAAKGEDLIGCAITSNPESDGIPVACSQGSLPFPSKIKHWQIHTFLRSLAVKKIARISAKTHEELLDSVHQLFRR